MVRARSLALGCCSIPLLFTASCGAGDSERSVLDQTLAALGGERAVTSLKSIGFAMAGTQSMADQGFTPGDLNEADGYTFEGLVVLDIAGNRLSTALARDYEFLDTHIESREVVLADGSGFSVTESATGITLLAQDGAGGVAPATAGALRQYFRLLIPHLVLGRVVSDGLSVIERRSSSGNHTLEVSDPIPPLAYEIESKTGEIVKMSKEQWQLVIDVNLTGATMMVRDVVAKMIGEGQSPGVIINPKVGNCLMSVSFSSSYSMPS